MPAKPIAAFRVALRRVAICVTLATTGAASPLLVYAQNAPRVPQLQVDPFWPKPLPNDWLLGQVAGVAVDSQGNVYTTEVNTGQRVQKFRRLDAQD